MQNSAQRNSIFYERKNNWIFFFILFKCENKRPNSNESKDQMKRNESVVQLWLLNDIRDFVSSVHIVDGRNESSSNAFWHHWHTTPTPDTINRNDLNAIGFHWVHAVFARTYDVPKSMKILDEAIVLHIIAFDLFFLFFLSSHARWVAHFFIRRLKAQAHVACSCSSYLKSITSSVDIWYLNGLCLYVAAGTWHEDSKWMISIDAVNGIVWIVNGRWKWIESRNIRIQFPVTHKLLQFTYVQSQAHINSNGLRTNSLKLEERIHITFYVIRFCFGQKKKCGGSNRSIAFHRITQRLFYFNTISAVHYWQIFCLVFALIAEATSIWHLSHLIFFLFAPVLNEREGSKLNETYFFPTLALATSI